MDQLRTTITFEPIDAEDESFIAHVNAKLGDFTIFSFCFSPEFHPDQDQEGEVDFTSDFTMILGGEEASIRRRGDTVIFDVVDSECNRAEYTLPYNKVENVLGELSQWIETH